MLVILCNTIFILVKDNQPNSYNSYDKDLLYKTADDIFLYIYTIEMFIKIFAYGFILNSESYLRDIWNVLDMVIIFAGWISYFLSKLIIVYYFVSF